jgi:cytochrome c oxidase subunit 2
MGRPIKLVMTSEDVIHSFFVPEFRAHMDVLPRRYTSVWFQANRRGVYNLYCSQYCGTNHAGMTGQIIVMHPAEYQRWLSQQAEGSLALEGRKLFLKYRCVSCHSADSDARAPVLENLFDSTVPLRDGEPVRADYDYLRRSIMQPSEQIVLGFQDVMPPFEGQLSEEQVIALIAYIRSLGHDETPDRVEDFPPPARTPAIGSEEKAP